MSGLEEDLDHQRVVAIRKVIAEHYEKNLVETEENDTVEKMWKVRSWVLAKIEAIVQPLWRPIEPPT